MTDKEKLDAIRTEIHRLVNVRGYNREIANDLLAFMDSLPNEPVSEGLLDTMQTITYNGEVYTRCYKDKLDAFACKYPMSVPKPSKRYAKYSDIDLTIAVKEGAKWQKEHLLKPADGDDLPIFDREVIVFIQPDPLEENEYTISFAHRPNPDGWDGISIITGKTEHYTPKTYDKGGWNIPNVKWWLDCSISKEIEL